MVAKIILKRKEYKFEGEVYEVTAKVLMFVTEFFKEHPNATYIMIHCNTLNTRKWEKFVRLIMKLVPNARHIKGGTKRKAKVIIPNPYRKK